jgi:uncharacterized OsmC-like protein
MAIINGVDVDQLKQTQQKVSADPSLTEREPTVVARWLGSGSTAEAEFDGITTKIGGDGNLNSMQTFLASLAACDVDLVVTHAALIGLSIEELRVEVTGHFNSRAYYLTEADGAGYDRIAYTVIMKAPGATEDQIKYLKERCQKSSPVGDSVARQIPLTLELKTE